MPAANALRLKSQPYDPAKHHADRRPLHRRCSPPRPSPSGRAAARRRDPIFIVGMPRAGSTLVEQILSSHSQVEGTAELPDMPALARETGSYPDAVLEAVGRTSGASWARNI